MKLYLKAFFLLCLMMSAQQLVSQNNIIDEIVWVVGDEAILKSDVEDFRKELLMQRQRIDGDPYCFIPEQIAVNKLFLDQAKIDSIEVQEANVNRMLEYYISEYVASYGTQEKLEEYFGKKMKEIRSDLRTYLREQQLITGVRDKITGNTSLTPSEIRKFYNSIPQDSLPFIATTMEVQIITMEPKIPLEEIDDVKAKLRDYTEQVLSGKTSFSTLALLHSQDDVSALRGGELGFMSRTEFVPEFANVAFSLNDPSKVSNVVETEFGYHIIQLIERRGDMANFRHILLRPKVSPQLLEDAKARLDSIRTQIEEDKMSFEYAVFYSADKNTRNNKGIMVNHSGRSQNYGTPRFELSELNQDVAKMVGTLQPGDITEPFIMKTDRGTEVAAIVRVTNRHEGHKANLATDYQIIKQMAEEDKKQRILDEWLQKKIENTYVRIDPEWRGCDFRYKGWIK